MIGKFDIIIQNRRATYKFTLKRNITILKGNSATGKTLLLDMINTYNSVMNSGVKVYIDSSIEKNVNIDVMTLRDWRKKDNIDSKTIYFIDEYYDFVKTDEFAEFITEKGIYVVIINRDKLSNLPYSVDEIYTLNTFDGSHKFKPWYVKNLPQSLPECIITEDEGSGNQFFKKICDKLNIRCLSAGGNSKILGELKLNYDGGKWLVVADGAAIGAHITELVSYCENKDISFYLPESFEWMLLNSGTVNVKNLKAKLERTYDYLESKEFKSWERFYTNMIVKGTKMSKHPYSKTVLDDYYVSEAKTKVILEKSEINFLLDFLEEKTTEVDTEGDNDPNNTSGNTIEKVNKMDLI